MALVKKENICIAEEYTSQGQVKKKWHRIGEIVTFSDDQGGTYQKVTLVGPHGVTNASVFEQNESRGAYAENNKPPF